MKRLLYFFPVLLFWFSTPVFTQELQDLFVLDTRYENRNGPLQTEVAAIWHLTNLYFQASGAGTLQKGEISVQFQWTLGNFFHEDMTTADHRYTIRTDVETYLYTFDFQYGITHWLTAGIRIPIIQHWSGIMDPYIQSFHRTFRSPNGGREYYEDNQINVYLFDNDTNDYKINIRSSSAGIGDVVLKTQFKIFQTENKVFGLGAVLALKLPTGNAGKLRGSGSLDFGGGVLVEFALFRWWIFYVNFFYSFNGNYKGDNGFNMKLVNRWQFTGASEWIISNKSSLIFQYTTFNSAWANLRIYRVSGIGIQAFLGFKYRISKNFTFQFYIMEDFEPWTTSDIVFNFGFHFKI